jgi:hypothetical protein
VADDWGKHVQKLRSVRYEIAFSVTTYSTSIPNSGLSYVTSWKLIETTGMGCLYHSWHNKLHDICLHTISVEFLTNCLSSLLSSSGHPERVNPWYFSSSCEGSTQTCPVKCVGSFISTDRATLPELIPVTVSPGKVKTRLTYEDRCDERPKN